MGLEEYRRKRDFKKTAEPTGGKSSKKKPIFVVQEHWASHHHFDFRLEAFGTLKSWAVPKGPSVDVGEKRLAVEVEDHPIDYAKFEGEIPAGEYGAGRVKIWDSGVWEQPENLKAQIERGRIEFQLHGKKLKGQWLLQRTRQNGNKSLWLLIKRHEKESPKKSKLKGSVPAKVKNLKSIDLSPQLALLTDEVPTESRWIFETKYDGYRTLAKIENKKARLFTRSGLDWTTKYAALAEELKKIQIESAVFDGEIVVRDDEGRSSFAELQMALKEDRDGDLIYYVFDLLYLNGHDLRDQPLEARKQLLKKMLKDSKSKNLIYSEHTRLSGEDLFKDACKNGLEGIIAKDRTQPYRPGRGDTWRKIKCSSRQEFVIGGYTEPRKSREKFGALLMGTYEGKKFRYVGRVGTGFNSVMLATVFEKLTSLKTRTNPFQLAAPKGAPDIHWVKPQLVAEIEFKTWTKDQILRQASFQGLREDKLAQDIHVERPQKIAPDDQSALTNRTKTSAAHQQRSSTNKRGKEMKKRPAEKNVDFKITHPERVIYPKHGITKLDVARYYKSVSPWLLAHTKDRPLSFCVARSRPARSVFFKSILT